MRIGLLLPSVLASEQSLAHRIFAPIFPAVQLADGLVDRGHEVFFYSTSDVHTKAMVIGGNDAYLSDTLSYYQMRDRDPLERKHTETEIRKRDFENDLTMRAYQDAIDGKLDVIHSYHDFAAHYFQEVTKVPTVYTLHNPLPQTIDTIEYERFNRFKHHAYISISNSQRISSVELQFLKTIYHGTEL